MQYDFLVTHVPVVGQYAAVCILAVEEVKLLALLLTLPLYDETAVEDGTYNLAVLIANQSAAKS